VFLFHDVFVHIPVRIWLIFILFFSDYFPPSPPVDIIRAMMIVWKIRGKVIRTVLCCVVYSSCAHLYAHTWAVL